MIPDNLETKQLELQEKSRNLRSKRNKKNASGPRKKENLPTRRSPRSALPALRSMLADPNVPCRYKMYLAYLVACYEEMKVLSYQEFYKYKEGQEADVETEATKFAIREPAPQQ